MKTSFRIQLQLSYLLHMTLDRLTRETRQRSRRGEEMKHETLSPSLALMPSSIPLADSLTALHAQCHLSNFTALYLSGTRSKIYIYIFCTVLCDAPVSSKT